MVVSGGVVSLLGGGVDPEGGGVDPGGGGVGQPGSVGSIVHGSTVGRTPATGTSAESVPVAYEPVPDTAESAAWALAITGSGARNIEPRTTARIRRPQRRASVRSWWCKGPPRSYARRWTGERLPRTTQTLVRV